MSHRTILGRTLLAVAAMLTLPVLASAQTSRVEGMSLQGDYIKDYTGIYSYLSEVPNVGNLVYAELGNGSLLSTNSITNSGVMTTDRSVGAVLGNLWGGRLGTWGIHLRQETPQLGQGDAFSQPAPGVGGGDPNHNANESFDLMWGKKFGTVNFGLRLNRSNFKYTDEVSGVTTTFEFDPAGAFFTGDENLARNIMGYGAGVGFELNPNTNVEASVLYQSRTFENSDGTGNSYNEDSPTTYMLAARAMWQWQPNVMVVPVFKWYSYDLSTQTTAAGTPPTTTTADNTLKGWQIGAAGNWTLGSNDLFVLGLTFAQNKVDEKTDLFGIPGIDPFTSSLSADLEATETLSPQIFAALETHVNSWLTLRFGANKGAFQKIKVEDRATPSETVEVTGSSFNMNIGAGVKLGTLQLDAILANNFPQTLGWLGSGQAGTYFPKVTATYSF